MKAINMLNNKGKAISDQTIIDADHGKYFQSYSSTIAYICDHTGAILLDEKFWSYSQTTSKYRNRFLGLTSAETKAKIKSGKIKLTNLN